MDSASQLNGFLIGIDTHQEPVIYMRDDCEVCHSEGLAARSRVGVSANNRSIIATLNVIHGETVPEGLTRAMVDCGERLRWEGATRVFDKHCVGGLPGNRTTPLVVHFKRLLGQHRTTVIFAGYQAGGT